MLCNRRFLQHANLFFLGAFQDFYQLIQPNLMLMRGPVQSVYKLHTESTFSEQFPGLTPRQYIELRALSGDTSDNIPGVAGVGEKTALKLIQEYLDVEGVIESAKSKVSRLRYLLNTEQGLSTLAYASLFHAQQSGTVRDLGVVDNFSD